MKIKPSYGAYPTPEAIDVNIYSLEVFGSHGLSEEEARNKYEVAVYTVYYNDKGQPETDTDDMLNRFVFESAEPLDEDRWYQIDVPSDLDNIPSETAREWVRGLIVDWA